MSLNPVLSQNVHTKHLLPQCDSTEAYVLHRPKTRVTLVLASRTLNGNGDIVLTTHRLVFIKHQDKDFKKGFSSISVPYSHLDEPRFFQPLFGTNHLKFTVKNHPLGSEGEFKVFFVSGGCQLFLKLFFLFYARFRNNPNLMPSANPFSDLDGDNCVFVDPNDLTHVYLTQPETAGSQEQTPAQEAAQEKGEKKGAMIKLHNVVKGIGGLRF